MRLNAIKWSVCGVVVALSAMTANLASAQKKSAPPITIEIGEKEFPESPTSQTPAAPAPKSERKTGGAEAKPEAKSGGTFKVTKVISGDSFELDAGKTIRLLGVNAPNPAGGGGPAECHGEAAKTWLTSELVGKEVRLGIDTKADKEDKQKRVLAYVWTTDDHFINQQLVAKGHAYAYTLYNHKYKTEFLQAQQQAMSSQQGLWVECQHRIPKTVTKGAASVDSNGNRTFQNTSMGEVFVRNSAPGAGGYNEQVNGGRIYDDGTMTDAALNVVLIPEGPPVLRMNMDMLRREYTKYKDAIIAEILDGHHLD